MPSGAHTLPHASPLCAQRPCRGQNRAPGIPRRGLPLVFLHSNTIFFLNTATEFFICNVGVMQAYRYYMLQQISHPNIDEGLLDEELIRLQAACLQRRKYICEGIWGSDKLNVRFRLFSSQAGFRHRQLYTPTCMVGFCFKGHISYKTHLIFIARIARSPARWKTMSSLWPVPDSDTRTY